MYIIMYIYINHKACTNNRISRTRPVPTELGRGADAIKEPRLRPKELNILLLRTNLHSEVP